MLQDPILTLVNLLTANLSVTKDDGSTKANVLVTSAWYSDMMMNKFDALVTITLVSDPVVISGEGDSREDHTVTVDVNVWTEHKYDTTGNRVITDSIIQYKLVQAIDQIIAANRSSMGNGIHRAKVAAVRPFDDPTQVPYPLRRRDMEVELFIPTITSLAA